jgi:hypothetical protein
MVGRKGVTTVTEPRRYWIPAVLLTLLFCALAVFACWIVPGVRDGTVPAIGRVASAVAWVAEGARTRQFLILIITGNNRHCVRAHERSWQNDSLGWTNSLCLIAFPAPEVDGLGNTEGQRRSHVQWKAKWFSSHHFQYTKS